MKDGWIKLACVTPHLRVADCEYNVREMAKELKKASDHGAALVAFPELSVTGYTCGDLFLQQTLLQGALNALDWLIRETAPWSAVGVVGLPISKDGALYNCAAVFCKGRLLGLVPKTHLPNYGEFYELRYFTPGSPSCAGGVFEDGDRFCCPFGSQLLFTCREIPDFTFGVELCEDVWVGDTPSSSMARAGATVIVNLSCSDEIIGKKEYRKTILQAKSGSLLCAYAYADAGIGESTQDMIFAGHNLILENGRLVAQSRLFTSKILYGDVDVQKLQAERRRSNTFSQTKEQPVRTFFSLEPHETVLERAILQMPFVPFGKTDRENRCEQILIMQSIGLATRMSHIGCKTAVVGLSGGLDSTLAFLVMVRAFDRLELPRSGILAVTMPCFGTTDRTYQNACRLAEFYEATLREIPLQKSVLQHFSDIGQPQDLHDVTYENAQARERTQVLMDLANQAGGIVVGTGDLSELALGWATYNGDHMSMYAVNASIPKTLVRYLVQYEADHSRAKLANVLRDVLDTPVSPELLPPEDDGTIAQRTEDLVGPYQLHDFFLYYMLRYGFTPRKLFRMANIAFAGVYEPACIAKWLRTFCRRFFAQQFKRSCLPDGPKVGSVTLSPRSDLRMPSDACAALWESQMDEIESSVNPQFAKQLAIRRRREEEDRRWHIKRDLSGL